MNDVSKLYDPIKRHLAIEKLVTKENFSKKLRKYYRFRADRWYGGIATADAVGCGLLCKFCWTSDKVLYRPNDVGDFYEPKDVALRLIKIAEIKNFSQIRISGGEPTIGKDHLLNLLNILEGFEGYTFILETNGILIGNDPNYAKELSKYRFIHVRVSLKGCNEEEFTTLTGAKPEGFQLQLRALKNLIDMNVKCHPAVMISFSHQNNFKELVKRIEKIDSKLANNIEIEELILYGKVAERLKKYNLKPITSYQPDKIPNELI